MKTVMKKLLSLMLVAVLLVSAVPFQASAAMTPNEDGAISVPVVVYLIKDSEGTLSGAHNKTLLVKDGETVTLNEATIIGLLDNREGRTLASVSNGSTDVTNKPLSYGWLKKTAPEGYALTAYVNDKGVTGNVPPDDTSKDSEDNTSKVVTFYNEKVDQTYTYNVGDTISLPATPFVSGFNAVGWAIGGYYHNAGDPIELTAEMGGKTYTAYYAPTTEKDENTVNVYVKRYVGSTLKETKLIHTNTLKTNDNILDYLKDQKAGFYNYIKEKYAGYTWNGVYYNYYDKEVATANDLTANGAKNIYIKIYAEKEADVLVYVYKASTKTCSRTISITGYEGGETITYSVVKGYVDDYYKIDNMTMYDADGWADYVAGKSDTSTHGVTVKTDGTLTKIYVYLSSASTTKGDDSDSTNPKTGDMIFVPMIFMLVSAAAIVACVYGKKRMVK